MKFFTKYRQQLLSSLVIACGIFLGLEILRDMQREGDFGGYIEAGKLAWQGDYIYSAHRNTWPPFMSLAAIPLFWLNSLSFIGLRLIWLLGIVVTYWYVFRWTLSFFLHKKLVFRLSPNSNDEVSLTSAIFLVPFLLTFRIFIEEVSNLQINVTILGACVLSLIFTLRGKNLWAGLLLALVISIKVYPLILLPFLFYKKEFKTALYTILGLVVYHGAVLLYFGQNSSALYLEWYTKQVANGLQCIHFNQSLWSFFCGLFSDIARFEAFQYNIATLSQSHTKLISIAVIVIIGMVVAFRFFKTKNIKNALAVHWLIVISFIPVFSPLAWKYYFVFLVPVVILLYKKLHHSTQIWFLYIPLFIITFTSEMFIGNYLSDITESLGFITLSSLFISLLATYKLTTTS